jgi:hypothetical protein
MWTGEVGGHWFVLYEHIVAAYPLRQCVCNSALSLVQYPLEYTKADGRHGSTVHRYLDTVCSRLPD